MSEKKTTKRVRIASKDSAPKAEKGQITRWLCKDGHAFRSEHGNLSPGKWCEAEAARTGAKIIETSRNGVNYIALTKA